jgi:O-antigen/teichoic acid export membrane protein
MNRSIVRGFVSVFGTRVGVYVISLLTTPFIVRFLGTAAYGDYALLISMYAVLTVFTHSGVFNGIRKFVAENRSTENWVNQIFGFYVRTSLVVTGVTVLAILTLIEIGIPGVTIPSSFQYFFVLLSIYLFIDQFYPIGRGVLMGLGLEEYSEPIQIVKRLVLSSTALVFLSFGFGVDGVLFGQILSAMVVVMISAYLLRDRISFRAVLTPLDSTISGRELLSFNFYSVLLAFLTISLYHTDILILRPVVGATETGYYKAALVVAEFLWLVPTSIQYVLVQSTSELWADGRYERITEIASTTTRINLSLVLIMSIGLGALAEAFIPVYFGPEFSPAVGPLMVLLPGIVGFAVSRPIFAIGQGKGELRSLVLTTGGAATLNLGLNLVLIPEYGMLGAAVATSIGYGSMSLLHIWTARQIGFDPVADVRVSRILASSLLCSVVVLSAARLLPSLVGLVVVPPLGFVCYVGVSMYLQVFDVAEVNQVKGRLPDRLKPLADLALRAHPKRRQQIQ